MKKHVKNYYKSIGICAGDFVGCEVCGKEAVDIHHIIFGRFKRSDEPDNLVALCRECHNSAHGIGGRINKDILLKIAHERSEV